MIDAQPGSKPTVSNRTPSRGRILLGMRREGLAGDGFDDPQRANSIRTICGIEVHFKEFCRLIIGSYQPENDAMRRLRFSVFDLFVITLGVAAGLAYHRVPGVSWSDALLLMCATWIAVGMVQQMRIAYVVWSSLPDADEELRNGAALAMARPIAVVAMLAAAVGLEIAKEFELDVSESIALDAFTDSLFSLAIICRCTVPGRAANSRAPPRNTVVQSVVGLLVWVLGCVWLVYVLISAQTISGLVHIAIRGVEVYQPTRWSGKPFHAFDPQDQLLGEFFRSAIVAASAVAVSAISVVLLTVYWNRSTARRLLIGMSTAGIVWAAYLVHWYWTVGFPSVSPYLAANTGTQPWYVIGAGISVFALPAFCLRCDTCRNRA